GLARRTGARRLVGFDVNPVDLEHLGAQARNEGVSADLPDQLVFCVSEPGRLPAESGSFDFVSTWSAFDHEADPLTLLKEIRRGLGPRGQLFLQLWPFYLSERGSHLWDWFPEPFHHLRASEAAIVEAVQASELKTPEWTSMMVREFRQLNRVTLNELQRC